jgi:hypothetical protein
VSFTDRRDPEDTEPVIGVVEAVRNRKELRFAT